MVDSAAVGRWITTNAPVAVLLVATIAFGTINRVIYKIQLVPMGNYPMFLGWLLSVAYCVIYWGILYIRAWLGFITPEQYDYKKKYKFVLMGLGDAVGYVFGIFAARRVSGYLLVLLPQSMVPMTMVLTYFYLKQRYTWLQVLGVVLLIGGVVVSLIPSIRSAAHSSDTSAESSILTLVWAFVYILSCLPNAISFTLKEDVFKDVPTMDIFMVNSMDSIWQLIFELLLFPLVCIPGFGGIPWNDLPAYMTDGAYCYLGMNPTLTDDCRGMPWLNILYVVINLSWNISLLLLLKKGGAVLMFIASSVSMPLANLAFAISWPLLPALPLTWENGVSLVVVLAGLVIYRGAGLWHKHQMAQRDALSVQEDVRVALLGGADASNHSNIGISPLSSASSIYDTGAYQGYSQRTKLP